MGGRGSSGGAAKSGRENGISSAAWSKINSEMEKIRDARRENLRVFDENGNLIYSQGGKLNHTGYDLYGEIDYKGKIAMHNHPKGTAPYPSDTDLETYQSSGAKEMIIVSPEYTVRLREDPNTKLYLMVDGKKEYHRSSLTQAAHIVRTNYPIGKEIDKIRDEQRMGKYDRKTMNQKLRKAYFKFYKEAAKLAGYKMTVTKKK